MARKKYLTPLSFSLQELRFRYLSLHWFIGPVIRMSAKIFNASSPRKFLLMFKCFMAVCGNTCATLEAPRGPISLRAMLNFYRVLFPYNEATKNIMPSSPNMFPCRLSIYRDWVSLIPLAIDSTPWIRSSLYSILISRIVDDFFRRCSTYCPASWAM